MSVYYLQADPSIYMPVQEIPQGKQFYRFRHDEEIGKTDWRLGYPEVYWLAETGMRFTAWMQWLSFDLFRYGVPQLEARKGLRGIKEQHQKVYSIGKAFANKLGYGATPPVRNCVLGENLNANDPELDKTRVCGGFTGLGEIKEGILWWNYLDEPSHWETVDFVVFDSIRVDKYNELYHPSLGELLEHPWLYFHAVVARKNKAGYFPDGVQEDTDPIIYEPTLVPFFSSGPVGWPLQATINKQKVDFLQPVPSIANPYVFGYEPFIL